MHARRLGVFLVAAGLLVTSCAATPILRPPTPAGSVASAGSVDAELSRFDSMQQLITQSFLPEDEAACVVDQVFFESGVFNLNSVEAANVDQAQIIADCTLDRGYEAPDAEALEQIDPDIEIEELEVETGEIARVAPFELTAATTPAFDPGGLATGEIELGGKKIEYATITPRGFSIGDSAPVFFALPPGGQGMDAVTGVAESVYLQQAVARGWVVVSPASPGGRWWDDDNTAVVPDMISWINAWVRIEGGRPHLGGMSNGGLSAFHIIAQDPTAFRSVLAYPGFPQTDADQAALVQLADVPVRLWVGGDDPEWRVSSETTVSVLEELGADVRLKVYTGEGHVIRSIAGGLSIFNSLDALQDNP